MSVLYLENTSASPKLLSYCTFFFLRKAIHFIQIIENLRDVCCSGKSMDFEFCPLQLLVTLQWHRLGSEVPLPDLASSLGQQAAIAHSHCMFYWDWPCLCSVFSFFSEPQMKKLLISCG